MNAENLPDVGFDWNTVLDQFLTMLQTTGVEFVKNLVVALIIFYAGRWVVGPDSARYRRSHAKEQYG